MHGHGDRIQSGEFRARRHQGNRGGVETTGGALSQAGHGAERTAGCAGCDLRQTPRHPACGSPDAAQRAALLRRGALLIRGPSCLTTNGSRLCGAAQEALHRVRDTETPTPSLAPLSSCHPACGSPDAAQRAALPRRGALLIRGPSCLTTNGSRLRGAAQEALHRVRDTETPTPSSAPLSSRHPACGSPDAAQRAALPRRGALLIRGPSCLTTNGSRLCGAAQEALHRVRDTETPTPSSAPLSSRHPACGSPDAAQRAALPRRGALLIRGPSCLTTNGSRLRGAAQEALHRVRDTETPRLHWHL